MVIEEPPPVSYSQKASSFPYYLLTLSAQSAEALQQKTEDLEQWLRQNNESVSPGDLCFTLNAGRKHFSHRFAWVIRTPKDFLSLPKDRKEGNLRKEDIDLDRLLEEIRDVSLSPQLYEKKLSSLAAFYNAGYDIPWEDFYQGTSFHKIALPTYPFARESYWIEKNLSSVDLSSKVGSRFEPFPPAPADLASMSAPSQEDIQLGGKTKREFIETEKTPEEQLRSYIESFLKKTLSQKLKIQEEKINIDEEFGVYGLDSIMSMELTDLLEAELGDLPRTLFFEYQNIQQLAGYFVENHSAKLRKILDIPQEKTTMLKGNPPVSDTPDQIQNKPPAVARTNEISAERTPERKPESEKNTGTPIQDIAIIGVSGRYPMAENLDEFWENLKTGKDCITEIPKERWDFRLYYDSEKGKPGKTNSKWGGFLKSIDQFDPLFFTISPREAELMDPQERLFLQEAWLTIEDAGYNHEDLCDSDGIKEVGVFVGVTLGLYQLFRIEEILQGKQGNPNSNFWAIANRVSYFFNFQGPSYAIDSACSSSLNALHLACESLKRRECRYAIAGGVNLSLHPKNTFG